MPGQAFGFKRPQPAQVRRHNGGQPVLLERLVDMAGVFQRFTIKQPRDVEVGVELQRFLSARHGSVVFTPDEADQDLVGGHRGPQRVGVPRCQQNVQSIVQTVLRDVQHCQPDVDFRRFRAFPLGLQQFRLGLFEFVLEKVQAMRAIGGGAPE